MSANPSSAPSPWAQRMGYGGLLPYVALAVAVWWAPPAYRAPSAMALLGYAACIASFLGAIHWGLVMRDASRQSLAVMGWGILPSLLAWVALLLGPQVGLWLTAALLWTCFAVDRVVYRRLQLQGWLPMRLLLTLVASACCLAAASRPALAQQVPMAKAVPVAVSSAAAMPTAAACPALLQHQFPKLQDDSPQNLCQYAGKAVLVVNTASYCGFTSQYQGLEALYAQYQKRGLVVLGFPSNDFGKQEPGSSKEIADFCFNTYGVKFPMFAKSVVRGPGKNALYASLEKATGAAPQWNFHKYLIDRSGKVVSSFASEVEPQDPKLLGAINRALQ